MLAVQAFLLCSGLLLHRFVAAIEDASTGLALTQPGSSSDVLLVTLLDGHVVAVDHNTGRTLWTFDSGSPLVSAKQSLTSSQGLNVFPGTDGGLYAYNGIKHLNPGLERLPISLPELVEAAPSLTADGSVILGKRESKVFLLDKRTGRSIGTLSNAADALEDHTGSLGLSVGLSHSDLLFLGRQDYVVRSVRANTKAETWNATFSRLYTMSSDTSSIKEFLQNGAAPRLGAVPSATDLPRLVVGSDNSLQAFDSKTMMRKWYIAFDTPPVSAYRQDGSGGNCLDPDQAASGSSARGLLPRQQQAGGGSSSRLRLPGHKLKGRLAGGTTVLVGALEGSLYALPADHLMLAVEDESGAAAGSAALVWQRRVGRLPNDITPASVSSDYCQAAEDEQGPAAVLPGSTSRSSRAPQQLPGSVGGGGETTCAAGSDSSRCDDPAAGAGAGGEDSRALAVVDDSGSARGLVPLQPSDSGVVEELGSLTCPQPPLGIHSISVQEVQTVVSWLPGASPPAPKESEQSSVSSPWSSLKLVLTSLVALLLLPTLLLSWRGGYTISISNTKALAAAQQQPVGAAAAVAPQTEVVNGVVSPSSTGKKHKSKSKSKQKSAQAAPLSPLVAPEAADLQHVNDAGVNDLQLLPPAAVVAAPAAAAAAGANGPTSPVWGPASTAPSAAGSGTTSPVPSNHLLADGSGSASGGMTDPGALSPISPVSAAEAGGVLTPIRSFVDEDGAVVIGRLRVGPGILGYGSAGTIVYEGCLDSRPVAVKRLLRQFYNLARKEIQVLVVSDEHPNVVRCFAMEEDREFVYLALERCRHSLSDTMATKEGQEAMQDPATGSPTPWCMSVLSDIAAGLAALHERQIVHRDLKPHNVLLTEAGRAKLSDMGLSKQLMCEQSSFESHGSGGSSGWQAPEQLMAKDGMAVRQSRAVDVFSFGCIMHYCLTGGRHPFGDAYDRDPNILRGAASLGSLQRWPEAHNLVAAMLQKTPGARPHMGAVLGHPFWWSDEQKLQFLVDVSDRVENEDREPDPSLLNALESYSLAAIGPNWGAQLDSDLIANLGKYRRYDYTCLRDLLRVVRNKRNHFREMPENLQQLLGPVPEGFYRFFSSRFPMLLLGVFFFALKHLDGDPNLAKYWAAGQVHYAPFLKPWDNIAAAAVRGSSKAGRESGGGKARRNSNSGPSRLAQSSALPPSPPPSRPLSAGAAAAAGGGGSATAAGTAAEGSSSGAGKASAISYSRVVAAAAAVAPASSGQAAAMSAPGDGGGSAGNGSASAAAGAAAPTANGGGPPVVGYAVAEGEEQLHVASFPSRPGKQLCDFYVKTGHCKYGLDCVYDHPAEYAVPLTEEELPFRPEQPICTFYQKTKQCKFGPSCKFHHPKLVPIYAGSAIQQH